MATARSWAQAAINCEECSKSAQQFCNSCQVTLCVECVPKHVIRLQSGSHDIVHFRNRKAQLIFNACEVHEGQRCEALCQQCNIPICIKCCIGPHKHHDNVDISDLVQRKKEKIQRETEEIKNDIIPYFEKTNAYLKKELRKITADINQVEEETETLRGIWHQEVDYLFDKLGSFFAETRKRNSETLRKHENKIKEQTKYMTKALQRNKHFLKTNNASDIAEYRSKIDNYRYIDNHLDFKKPTLRANTLRGEKLDLAVGKIQATFTFSPVSSEYIVASDRTNEIRVSRTQKRLDLYRTDMNRY